MLFRLLDSEEFFSNPDPAKLLVVVHETEIDCM